MHIFKKAVDLQEHLLKNKSNSSIGFVPTMGDLHDGHLSLLSKSIAENNITVCSIFVNPTQFNEASDYENYPQVLDKDIITLSKINVDIVFAPSVDEIYPNGQKLEAPYNIGNLEHHIEGEHRPGHFQGVCQVVHRLLEAVNPHKLYMGEKDYQQVAVIQKLIEIMDLKIELVPCPIIRESHGLAMSSRNSRLSDKGFQKAGLINKCLSTIKREKEKKEFSELKTDAIDLLKTEGFKTEYILLVNAETFEILSNFSSDVPMRLLCATWYEDVRLIDNISV